MSLEATRGNELQLEQIKEITTPCLRLMISRIPSLKVNFQNQQKSANFGEKISSIGNSKI